MTIETLLKTFDQIKLVSEESNLDLKVCGSFGIYLNCLHLKNHLKGEKLEDNSLNYFSLNYSSPRDLDLVTYFSKKALVKKAFSQIGFQPEKKLELIPGLKRSIFKNKDMKVDVFYDTFDFNHVIEINHKIEKTNENRLRISNLTIPITELLLQKLQIVEIGKKDLIAVWWIFNEFDIHEESDTGINLSIFKYYLSNDWGFYHTVKTNLEKILTICNEQECVNTTSDKIKKLLDSINAFPKSLMWKLRSKIGTSVTWYTEVENI